MEEDNKVAMETMQDNLSLSEEEKLRRVKEAKGGTWYDACRKAIENYEKGCDLFLNEEVQEIKAAGENIKQVIKSSDKKAYILCGILLIALIIKFIIG